jgi:hypothetical protein
MALINVLEIQLLLSQATVEDALVPKAGAALHPQDRPK